MTTTTMTTSRIIYQSESGGVSVIVPTGSVELALKDVPENTPYFLVSTDDIPSDRYFRNAWEIVSEKLQINLDKAKEIHRDKIRAARTPLLSKLDVQFQRALETSADTKDIVAQKQALRDATEDSKIAAATTTDAIKASWNTELLGDSPYQQ